jgi:pimeloyl-ACP methyl ester carboxylesterase
VASLTHELVEEQRQLAGVTLQVLSGGKGEPLLLLHDCDYLNRPYPYLEALAQRFDVVVPSHPGFGHSDLPPDFRLVEDIAYLYLTALRELFGDRPCSIIGCGFGGWIASEMAIRCTHGIRKLVLVDALGVKVSEPTVRDIADLFVLTSEELIRAAWLDPELGRQSMRLPQATDASEDELVVFYRDRQTAALLAWNPFMHNPNLLRHLSRIDVPTLVLWGEADRIVKPSYGERYAQRIPGAEFRTVANAGHYPYLEQPESFVATVETFLGRGQET